MKSRLIALLFVLAFTLVLVSSVFALGITPGRTTINYEEGLEKTVQFSILNNEHKNLKVFLTVSGELNDSVTLFDNLVEFLPSEESKQFEYKLNLPSRIALEPGLHEAEIVALEIPEVNGDGTYVGATVAVVSQIHVNVPYPGKYLEADLNLLDAEENSTATFIIPIINRGQVGIENARAIIDIYNFDNEKKASVETDILSLDPLERRELSGKWDIDLYSGNYLAKVNLFYDGETRNFEKQISVGKNALSIESILVNNFRLGEIAKLQILVENKWNQNLENVFANLLVYNDKSQVMADIKSASEDVPTLSKKELIAYWDTGGVSEGEYNGKLLVHYNEKTSDRNLILDVSEDSLNIFGVGYAINPKGNGGFDITSILLVLVIILFIINLAWFVFFRRLSKKK